MSPFKTKSRRAIIQQKQAQAVENVGATQITKTQPRLESLFGSFVETLTRTCEGWRGLKQYDLWKYRKAAETYLGRGR